TFTVTDNGKIDYADSLQDEFSGRGTTTLIDAATPYCSVESNRARLNGWALTPLQCQGITQQTATGFVDTPTPIVAPAARLSGRLRPPNHLRNIKAAGGDPVLSDGEFSL